MASSTSPMTGRAAELRGALARDLGDHRDRVFGVLERAQAANGPWPAARACTRTRRSGRVGRTTHRRAGRVRRRRGGPYASRWPAERDAGRQVLLLARPSTRVGRDERIGRHEARHYPGRVPGPLSTIQEDRGGTISARHRDSAPRPAPPRVMARVPPPVPPIRGITRSDSERSTLRQGASSARRRPNWMESRSACHDASMMFSLTPIVVHVPLPSVESINTRVAAPVPLFVSSTRTL